MEFEFLGQQGDGFSFRTTLDGVTKDYGVFNLDIMFCTNKDEVRAAEMADEEPVEKICEQKVITHKTDYFGEVDLEDNEALATACKKYLTEIKGINF